MSLPVQAGAPTDFPGLGPTSQRNNMLVISATIASRTKTRQSDIRIHSMFAGTPGRVLHWLTTTNASSILRQCFLPNTLLKLLHLQTQLLQPISGVTVGKSSQMSHRIGLIVLPM